MYCEYRFMKNLLEDGIFGYLDYKEYLRVRLKLFPKSGHGVKTRLAQALRCEPSYVSRVLEGNAQFSLEQADLINTFLGHSDDEATYFLLLVQIERAGTENLRKRFSRDLEEIRKRRLVLKHRLKVENTISERDQYVYFSQWIYAAVHVALTVPHLQRKDELAKYFGLPLSKISKVLDFLVSLGLAVQERERFVTGSARFHLGNDSPLIAKNHIDWRLQAIRNLERDEGSDLHYSSAVSIGAKDVERLKATLVRAIENFKAEVRESPAETLCAFALDFYIL